MKREIRDASPGRRSAGSWKLAVLAVVLAAGAWLLLRMLLPVELPEEYPKLPDAAAMKPAVRTLLVSADRDARKHPESPEAVGRLGLAYHANEYFDRAAAAYRVAARLAPHDARWAYAKAFLAEETGDERQQSDLLQQTVRLNPGHVPALVKLGDRSFKQDNLEEAGRYYEQALKFSGNTLHLQATFGLARIAARRHEWQKVIDYVAAMSRAHPYVRPPYQLLQSAYEARGETRKAVEVRENLASDDFTDMPPAEDPFHDELIAVCYSSTRLLKQAGLLSRFGHPERAIQTARRAAESDPADPDPHNFIARTLLTSYSGKSEAMNEALTHLAECLRLKPDDPAPLFGFANTFFETAQPPEAVDRLQSLLLPYARREDADWFLGLVADAQGKTQEALSRYEAAVRRDPGDRRIYNKLGVIYAKSGRVDEAIEYLQKSVRLNPLKPDVRLNLGILFMRKGSHSQALKEFAEVIRLNPEDAAAHFLMGFAFLSLQKSDEAVARFHEGLRYDPNDAGGHYGLASALFLQRRREQAIAELHTALKLRPDYPEAQDLLKRLAP
jgi:tetratricopeptide (TPR) repeat protein